VTRNDRARLGQPQRQEALLHGPKNGTDPPTPGPGSLHTVAIRHPQKGNRFEDFARQLYLDSLAVHGSTSHTSTDDRLVPEDGILDHATLAVA